jgi:hypothetical protein
MTEAAHILFPSDAPAAQEKAPDWYQARNSAAEARLMGGQKRGDEKPADPPAGDKADDAAGKIFTSEKATFDDTAVSGFMDTHVLSAIADGDAERGEQLKAATAALTDDFRSAGTDSNEVKTAFEAFREANDVIGEVSPEKIEADMTASLATLQSELGTSFQSDLNAARAFIRDLETVAPGTVASLERKGAVNDLKLVRAAIREAKRRGY